MFSGRELAVYNVGMLTLWPWHRTNTSPPSQEPIRTCLVHWPVDHVVAAILDLCFPADIEQLRHCILVLTPHTRTHAHIQQLFFCSNGLLGPGTARLLPVLKPFHSCRGWVDYVSSRKLQLLNGNAVLNCRDGGKVQKKKTQHGVTMHKWSCAQSCLYLEALYFCPLYNSDLLGKKNK